MYQSTCQLVVFTLILQCNCVWNLITENTSTTTSSSVNNNNNNSTLDSTATTTISSSSTTTTKKAYGDPPEFGQMKCGKNKEAVGTKCCTKCLPGQGMVRLCHTNNDDQFVDTICQPCSLKSKTFNTVSSAKANCLKCNPCGRFERVAKGCTVTSDTVCVCTTGHYRSAGHNNKCTSCSKCQPGTGRVKPCTQTKDTVCKRCSSGQFSKQTRGNRFCTNCTACPENYLTETTCSEFNDTVCRHMQTGELLKSHNSNDQELPLENFGKDHLPFHNGVKNWMDVIDNGNGGKGGVIVKNNQQQQNNQNKNSTNNKNGNIIRHPTETNNMIPVYCALLGLLICGLVIWVVYKYVQRRRNGQKSTSSFLSGPISPQIIRQQQEYQRCNTAKPNSVDSGFCGSEIPVGIVPPGGSSHGKKFKDISSSRFQRLENILCNDADPSGWHKLATELGYNEEDIGKFESECEAQRQSAVHLMLKDWSLDDQHTLGRLSKALHKAGRKDAVFLIKEVDQRHHHHHHHKSTAVPLLGKQLKEDVGLTEMCQV